ncbi:MAG: aminotransferase class I/II-fold pyridoxal phosphate-dependent enzyme [Treponema sp.]|jgi:histidinol-phosphate aminotransferase|nr:aminotransferase class I/II-fold pyridoxal phosphate-dependent enzyme [Treponema sp.]
MSIPASLYWSSAARGLAPYIPGEQPRDRAFIKLNTNENPYPPSPAVIKAMEALLSGGGETLRLYPDPLCMKLREAAALAYGVTPANVFPGNGSDEVLAFAFRAFFESAPAASAPVIFPDITYSFYPVYAALWGIPYKTKALADDFSIDPRGYDDEAGGAVIPNPNAPTGRALSLRDIAGIADALEKRRKVFIVDEAYAAFGAESAVSAIGDHPNLLTVHTLSKSASLAGLRVGFAIGSEALIEGLFRVRDSFNSYTLDALALAGGAAALGDRPYYDALTAKITAVRSRTAAALAALGFTVIPSKANFLLVKPPRCDGGTDAARGISAGARFLAALRERGILVRHFTTPRIADYVRVSMGSDADMESFLAACGEIIA